MHKVGLFSFQISTLVLTKPFGSDLGGSNSTIYYFDTERRLLKSQKPSCFKGRKRQISPSPSVLSPIFVLFVDQDWQYFFLPHHCLKLDRKRLGLKQSNNS